MERGFLVRDIFKQLITLLLFYLLMSVWWGDEQWFQDKIKELSFFLGVAVMFMIASFGTSLITRPVTIEVNQENQAYGKNETNFSINRRGRTQEHERTVNLKLQVIRNNSIWSKIVLYILKRKNISVLIEPVTPGVILEADNESERTDLTATTSGFKLNIDEYIGNIIMNSDAGPHIKGCAFVIQENRNQRVTDELIHVTPLFIANDNNAPLWLTLLVKFKRANHSVNFKWE